MADLAWTREEVEAIVADYLHMLTLELSGQRYNKSAHRQALRQKLRNRSDGSIERKHQNISATMIELGCPYISGYKPLGNYQSLLLDIVADRIAHDQLLDQSATAAAEQPAAALSVPAFDKLLTESPSTQPSGIREEPAEYQRRKAGMFRDYLAREARNRSLGAAGEALVVAYEQHRLHTLGKKRLADRVEHIATTQGDGLGYDVLSFEFDGRERYIEVKTTAFGRDTPFFLTRPELSLSQDTPEQFHLYRLYDFRQTPRMFDLPGRLDQRCRLNAFTWIAHV